MKINVLANQDLFDRYRRLGYSISMLASIIQNDTEISYDDFAEFNVLSGKFAKELEKLQSEVNDYLDTCAKTKEDSNE